MPRERFVVVPDNRDNQFPYGCLDLDNGQCIAAGHMNEMEVVAKTLNNPYIDVAAWQPFEFGPQTLLIPPGRRMSQWVQHKMERVVAAMFDVVEASEREQSGEF